MKRRFQIYLVLAGLISVSATIKSSSRLGDDDYFEITKNLRIFSGVYSQINSAYVDKPQPGELMKVGIDAMLASLDPYTVYIPESRIEDYKYMTTGQYAGIGAIIKGKDDYIVIAEPYENSPALKAGLRAGDLLIEVDGKSVKGKTTSDMSLVLKGGVGTSVTVKYKRDGVEHETTIEREEVKVPDVPYYGMIDDEVGYVKLTSFTATAGKEVGDALVELKETSSMKKVIFDLRGNGGGLMAQAVHIVNFWVDKGVEVVSMRGRIEEMNYTFKSENAPLDLEMPVVVLVDDHSASASEIVSGSLQDLDRAVVVGKTTFGKGLVQKTKDINFGSMVKYTVAKYYTPSGRCIQKLDYSNRDNEGIVHEFADSLRHSFTTKNGREVMDGRGVDPDVTVEEEMASKLTAVLVTDDLIFDYASEYIKGKSELASPDKFALSDDDYADFVKAVVDAKIDYETDSEMLLARLEKVAKEEGYFDHSKQEFVELSAKLAPNTESDLNKYKEEIIRILENEIVSRYYYQNGRIEHSLSNDVYIKSAIEVLKDEARYKSILAGQN